MTARLREWIADDVDRLAVALWSLAHRLRPVYVGPLCPDCGRAPDPGDGECSRCRDEHEAQRRDDGIFAAGREQGYVEGCRDMEQRFGL